MEIPPSRWSTADRQRGARPYPKNEWRQPALGRCVKKTRERHAVREVKEDPSEPSCRGRLQTSISCFGQKPRWCTLWPKGVTLITASMDERAERKRPSVEASKCFRWHQNRGLT